MQKLIIEIYIKDNLQHADADTKANHRYSSIHYQFRCSNRAKEKRNGLQAIKRRKANWIGHTLRKNCLLKHVIEGTIQGRPEVMGRRGI
jgi:hypothetical protein